MSYEGPNYTQTPNLFLDEHLPEMGCAETKVVLAVIRKTFGWHKDTDRLSISQLMEMTGLSNRAVIDGTKAAMKRGVIDREQDGNSYRYWLVVGGENSSQGGVNEVHRGGEDTSQEGVNDAHTQKKKKETNTKERHTHEGGESDLPIREDDSPGVVTWVEVTGERPLIQQIDALKVAFSGEDGPPWREGLFRDAVKEAWLNCDREPNRIKIGRLLRDYKIKLKYDDSANGFNPSSVSKNGHVNPRTGEWIEE